jgi:hypothetical protein
MAQQRKQHLIKLIRAGAKGQQRGRHQSDDSVTNESSSDDSEQESGGEERDETVAQENVQLEAVQFTTELAPGLNRQWFGQIVRMNKRDGASKALVVDLDKSDMHNGSKEAFIRLLECADECLGCARVYVTARRDRGDQTTLMRTFMYLGFKPVPPQTMPAGVDTKMCVCLATEL